MLLPTKVLPPHGATKAAEGLANEATASAASAADDIMVLILLLYPAPQ